MANDEYVLSHTPEASERERLGLIERLGDIRIHRLLAMLGIQQGWRCLEVGAGLGSVARWLAAQVGPQGKVVATDINPRFLTEIELSNVEVRQHDIRTDPIEPGTYDLAHCRALLANWGILIFAVERMVEALRIGGWLLVEEPDHSSLRAVDEEHPHAELFNRKIREVFERVAHWSGTNVYIGCRVRSLLEEAGLTEVGNEGRVSIARGGELYARRICLSFQAFMERGLLSRPDFAELQSVFSNPSFSYITGTIFAAMGEARPLSRPLSESSGGATAQPHAFSRHCNNFRANTRSIMANEEYVLSRTADAFERERLDVIERLQGASKRRHLAALAIRQGWRCLEVGAGTWSGSAMARGAGRSAGPGRRPPTSIRASWQTLRPTSRCERTIYAVTRWSLPVMTWRIAGPFWRTCRSPCSRQSASSHR